MKMIPVIANDKVYRLVVLDTVYGGRYDEVTYHAASDRENVQRMMEKYSCKMTIEPHPGQDAIVHR